MKTVIACVSVHHGNTDKIARVIADVVRAEIVRPDEIIIDELREYDLVGFGSGIYFGKHHRSLLGLIDRLPHVRDKSVFIFSTSGVRNGLPQLPYGRSYHAALRTRLLDRGYVVVGEFSCRGLDTQGPVKVIGGINKGRPNERDFEQARRFAHGLVEKMSASSQDMTAEGVQGGGPPTGKRARLGKRLAGPPCSKTGEGETEPHT